MLKQRLIKVLVGLALLLAVTGAAGVTVDGLGVTVTSPAHACNTAGGSGGGC